MTQWAIEEYRGIIHEYFSSYVSRSHNKKLVRLGTICRGGVWSNVADLLLVHWGDLFKVIYT